MGGTVQRLETQQYPIQLVLSMALSVPTLMASMLDHQHSLSLNSSNLERPPGMLCAFGVPTTFPPSVSTTKLTPRSPDKYMCAFGGKVTYYNPTERYTVIMHRSSQIVHWP